MNTLDLFFMPYEGALQNFSRVSCVIASAILVGNADISFFLIGPPREVQQVRQGGVGLLNGY